MTLDPGNLDPGGEMYWLRCWDGLETAHVGVSGCLHTCNVQVYPYNVYVLMVCVHMYKYTVGCGWCSGWLDSWDHGLMVDR